MSWVPNFITDGINKIEYYGTKGVNAVTNGFSTLAGYGKSGARAVVNYSRQVIALTPVSWNPENTSDANVSPVRDRNQTAPSVYDFRNYDYTKNDMNNSGNFAEMVRLAVKGKTVRTINANNTLEVGSSEKVYPMPTEPGAIVVINGEVQQRDFDGNLKSAKIEFGTTFWENGKYWTRYPSGDYWQATKPYAWNYPAAPNFNGITNPDSPTSYSTRSEVVTYPGISSETNRNESNSTHSVTEYLKNPKMNFLILGSDDHETEHSAVYSLNDKSVAEIAKSLNSLERLGKELHTGEISNISASHEKNQAGGQSYYGEVQKKSVDVNVNAEISRSGGDLVLTTTPTVQYIPDTKLFAIKDEFDAQFGEIAFKFSKPGPPLQKADVLWEYAGYKYDSTIGYRLDWYQNYLEQLMLNNGASKDLSKVGAIICTGELPGNLAGSVLKAGSAARVIGADLGILNTERRLVEGASNAVKDTPKTLYHYTNEKGLNSIVESNELRPSIKANNPKDARYGNGQYLSDITPETTKPTSLASKFIRVPNKYKYTHFVEIDVTGLEILNGRNGVYVIPNEDVLDITDRIVRSGSVGK